MCEYVHLKTHWAPQTQPQNLAVILQQFYYSKINFIALSQQDCFNEEMEL